MEVHELMSHHKRLHYDVAAQVSPNIIQLRVFRMRQRGAIVYRDLRPPAFPIIWILAAFVAGIAVFIGLLELAIPMDIETNQVQDPPLQPTESSDDDFYEAPPSPWTGVVLHLLVNLTLKQMLAQVFHLDADTPGLVRILCNSTVVDLRTSIEGLEWPRRLYIQIASYTEYQRSVNFFHQLQHAPVATPPEHRARGTLPVNICLHFISVFRALQQQDNLISSQSVVIARLEDRLRRLETAVSTNQPLVLTPRPTAQASVWYPPSPTTATEVASDPAP